MTIVVLGFVTVWTGMGQWSNPGRITNGYIAAWGVLVGVWLALWLGGLLLIPGQLKQRVDRMEMLKRENEEKEAEKAKLRRDSGQTVDTAPV